MFIVTFFFLLHTENDVSAQSSLKLTILLRRPQNT